MAAFKTGSNCVELFFAAEKKVLGAEISATLPFAEFCSPDSRTSRLTLSCLSAKQYRTTAIMFKPTQSMLARGRLRLTTKQVNGGYYKGNRTGSMGGWDKRGTYKPDFSKHRVYMAPEKLEVPGKYYPEDQRKEPFLVSMDS